MLKLLISCWDDGVVEACRYMFVMGSDVVLVLLLLKILMSLRGTEKCLPKHPPLSPVTNIVEINQN